MAIFQPTNIIPSSFTQGTIDVNDTMEISWQVNGNSAMTAFQIDFYLNDANSTPVEGGSTGKITYGIPPDGFYGTDRFGNPQFFTYDARVAWKTKGLSNGNKYKLKITQFYNEGGVEKSITQTSFASFITRDKPTLKLYQTKEHYDTPIELPKTLVTSIGYFAAEYHQQQGDPIRWIRWQVATANNGVIDDILADTGDVYTPTLNFEFNGFFNGQQYAIRAIGESESGQATVLQGADKSGWIFFNINLQGQDKYFGDLATQCLNKENAVLLAWEKVTYYLPVISPDSYQPSITSSGAVLGNGTLLEWSSRTGESLDVYQPYTFVWRGNLSKINISAGRTATLCVLEDSEQSLFTLSVTNNEIIWDVDGGEPITFPTPANYDSIAVIASTTKVTVLFYLNKQVVNTSSASISDEWQEMGASSMYLYGVNEEVIVSDVAFFDDSNENNTDIASLYNNADFIPVWRATNYQLVALANFRKNLALFTDKLRGSGFRVYRQEVGKNTLTPIATVPSTTTTLKDYGLVSRKAYKYSLYAYDSNGAFMGGVEAENAIATNFKNYSLLVCDYDEANDEYHVRKQYLFSLNLSAGSVGNNNKPTLNANFTPYPTRMGDTANYASGTLQGLIGAIYTVPALIEQIGNYKRTAKPSTMDYFDSVDLEKELYDLSVAPYQLFLRDMKGHLRMITTSGAISMTTNLKQKQQSISISFPWVEIGDASDVTIIQTPDDYGWNNDKQVLDVQLDVDVETGELSATYPFPYNGTKFYLTGVNKENLSAKTPIGVTPAQFELSDVAEEPNDGEVTATVTVNTENN